MAHIVKRIARGTTSKVQSYTGATGELVMDTTAKELVLQTGVVGGAAVAPKKGMTGATASSAGTMGLVPAPVAGDETKFLRGDGTWAAGAGGGGAKYQTRLTLSKDSVTVTPGSTDTVMFTTNSNGTPLVTTSDASVATATLSGDTITISGVGGGTANITLSIAATDAYFAARATISVVCNGDLNSTDWATIKSVGADGLGDAYWDIGDTKDVALNGNVGSLAVVGTYKLFIIDFNYRSINGVYFQGFKNSDGTDVALCDSKYPNYDTTGVKYFNMNHWGNYNHGGWKGCDLRYDILGSTEKQPSGYGAAAAAGRTGYDATSAALTSPVANTLMAALPAALRSNLAPWTVYTDNTGNSSNVAANVTSSIDYLPLLSEHEVHGVRNYANQYEQNQQTQMAYYKNGNSKVKYRHDSTVSAVYWWLRSPHYSYAAHFCNVSTGGNANTNHAHNSLGLAPAFRIA